MRRLAANSNFEEVPLPVAHEDGVLVRVERLLVLDRSELEACAGTVVVTGRAAELSPVGARVVGAPAVHAEYVAFSRHQAVPIPETLSSEDACWAGAVAAAIHVLRRSEATLGEWVALVGLGATGLLAVQIARHWGFRAIAIETDPALLGQAKERGAELALAPTSLNVALEATRNLGADRIVLGAANLAEAALRLARKRAKLVLLGGGALPALDASIMEREIEIVPAHPPGPGRGDSSYEEDGVDYPLGYVRWTAHRNLAEAVRLLASKTITPPKAGRLVSYPERPEAPLDRLPGAPAPLIPRPGPAAPLPKRRLAAAGVRAALQARKGSAVLTLRVTAQQEPVAFARADLADLIDLLGFLAGDPRPRLEVTANPTSLALLLRYGNGATATLLYANGAPSERLEAFKGGACFVLDQGKLEAHGAEVPTAAPQPATAEEASLAADAARLAAERASVLGSRA